MRMDRFAAAAFGLAVLGAALPASAVSLTAQQAQDRAAIEETMSRYMHALDTANPDAYANVYAPDGEIVLGGMVFEKGRKELHDYVVGLRKQWKMTPDQRYGKTRHIYYNFSVDLNGDKALARTYWQTLVANPKGGAWMVLATGTAEDSFVKIDGSWLIAKRVIFSDPDPTKTETAKKE